MNKRLPNNFLDNQINLRNIREERRKEVSKDALFQSCKQKIKTTMIGALDTIEKQFGFLWAYDGSEEITEAQEQLKEIYYETRAAILDRGNMQIRLLEAEFAGYDVNKKRYQINLPVSDQPTQEGDKNG